jgi:TRAP-type C4-dicarboxylate transport system permease small subunit
VSGGAEAELAVSARLGRMLAPVEAAMMLAACLAIAGMVMITAVDVVFRYALNAPFSWSHDLTTQYLLVGLFFLALPYVTGRGAHMTLDFAVRNLGSVILRNLFVMLGEGMGAALALGIAYGNWPALRSAWINSEVLPGSLPLPTWPMRSIVILGCVVLALRLLCGAVGAFEAMLAGRMPAPVSVAD